jgi:hypothetical protein
MVYRDRRRRTSDRQPTSERHVSSGGARVIDHEILLYG